MGFIQIVIFWEAIFLLTTVYVCVCVCESVCAQENNRRVSEADDVDTLKSRVYIF